MQAELTSQEPGRELRAIRDLRAATVVERALLRDNEHFMQLLRENLKGAMLSTAHKILGVSEPSR